MERSTITHPEFLKILRSLPGHHIFLQPDSPAFTVVEISDDFGYSLQMERHALLGKSIFEIMPDHSTGKIPFSKSDLQTALDKVLREKVPCEMPGQKVGVRENGKENGAARSGLRKTIPVLDEGGNVSFLLHSVADVTDGMVRHKSQNCAPVFEGISKTGSDGIWHRNLIAQEVNRFGTEFYQAFGNTLTTNPAPEAWEALIHPDDRNLVVNHFNSAIATPGVYQTELTYRVLKTDGTYADVSESAWIIRDRNGKATEMYGKATDITVRKKTDIEREVRIGELLKNNFELMQLSHIISHNLRSPIANLIGLGSLIHENKIDDPLTRKALEKYKQATQQLSNNVNDLFEMLTRKNNQEPQVEEVALDSIFKQVTASVETLIADSGAEIITDFSAGNRVNYLPGYLHSILLNLLTNAIKYRSPERKLKINVATERKENVLLLHFSDNGQGIDLEKYGDRIFGPYQKFHNNPDSTGLGLHLVATQVKAMDGNISVSSEPNKGSTFTIQFKV